MVDRRVRQHALDIGLHDCAKRTTKERQQRQHLNHRTPVAPVGRKRHHQKPQQPCKRTRLDGRGHEGGHRGGASLVHVGRPPVERHRRHLETEPDDHHGDTTQQQVVGDQPLTVEVGAHSTEAGGTGGAVEQCDAVQQKGRCGGTKDEVLQTRLERADAAAMHGGERVRGKRQDFQTDEQNHQVIGRCHHHGARRREHHERIGLDAFEALSSQITVEQQGHQHHCGSDHPVGKHRESVDAHRPGDRRGGATGGVDDAQPERHTGCHRRKAHDDGAKGRHVARYPVGHQRTEEQQQQGAAKHDQDRCQISPGDVGRHRRRSGLGGRCCCTG